MKGIILAGGRGSRLHPLTKVVCKQLLPVYDKPLIYYPLATLMQMGVREILLIATPQDEQRFFELLGDGSSLGIQLSYAVQAEPRGIADALLIGEAFIGKSSVALILGDNLFYGYALKQTLHDARKAHRGATVFGYEVINPSRYGIIDFSSEGEAKAIVEKPPQPPSRFAVTGLYLYDHRVVELAKGLRPSGRGELEITDINNAYLQSGQLACHLLDRGFAWLDAGTFDAMQKAAQYVQTIQERQGIRIGCIEEVAFEMGYIDEAALEALARALAPSDYADYLLALLSPHFSPRCEES